MVEKNVCVLSRGVVFGSLLESCCVSSRVRFGQVEGSMCVHWIMITRDVARILRWLIDVASGVSNEEM